MRRSDERRLGHLRVVLVGTGTGVGKTHVACALLSCWGRRAEVVGLKPIETGIEAHVPALGPAKDSAGYRTPHPPAARSATASTSDQERLNEAVRMFHVKQAGPPATTRARGREGRPAPRQASGRVFHVKRRSAGRHELNAAGNRPLRSLYAFADPVSPHLAAREAGTRIDLGLVERWVRDHERPVTVIETAGGLFSPLGCGATNFELTQALRPDVVLLIAPDRLGVLHELTTTLALAAARGGLPLAVVLSAPARKDASTGRNAAEMGALGIAHPIACFPRAGAGAASSAAEAARVIAWIQTRAGTRAVP